MTTPENSFADFDTQPRSALADWLWRNLRPHVEEMTVAEPRRNRLIAQDRDKDDPIAAQ